MNKLTYPVYFNVQHVTPDPRPYNQQRQIFVPETGTRVKVEIEINQENFFMPKKYFEAWKLWELGQGDEPEQQDLVFTSLGWSRVMEALEEPYNYNAGTFDLDVWADDDDEFENAWNKKEK